MACKSVLVCDADCVKTIALSGNSNAKFDLSYMISNIQKVTTPRHVNHVIWRIYHETIIEFFKCYVKYYKISKVHSYIFYAQKHISIINHRLTCDLPISDYNFGSLIGDLSNYIPIFEYRGCYGVYDHLLPLTTLAPHLNSVIFNSPFFVSTQREHQRFIDHYLSNTRITRYNYSSDKLDERYDEMIEYIIKGGVYPHVIEFFPVPWRLISRTLVAFPDLEILRISNGEMIHVDIPSDINIVIVFEVGVKQEITKIIEMFPDKNKANITYTLSKYN